MSVQYLYCISYRKSCRWISGGTAWNLAMATTKAQDQVKGGLLGCWWIPGGSQGVPRGVLMDG